MATIFVILIQANDDSLKLVATHIGGSGGIRTHGPISEPLVFKTRSISRTLTHFQKSSRVLLYDNFLTVNTRCI